MKQDVVPGTRDSVFETPETRPLTLTCLLVPGFSLLTFGAFLSPFRKANALLGREHFKWVLASHDGQPVACSLGFAKPVSLAFRELRPVPGFARKEMAVLIAGAEVEGQASADFSSAMRQYRRQKVPIVALGNATWLLAEMGALQGTRCTLHWDKLSVFMETFREPRATDAIYTEDEGIVSCAGEMSAFDLAVHLIRQELGDGLVEELCRHHIVDRLRDTTFRQVRSAWLRLGNASDKLVQAVNLMESNLQEPLALAEVSRHLKVSRRQVERLFLSELGCSPRRYYMKLRLDRARQLTEHSSMPLVEVAIACGFVSSSHFSKTFREHFGQSPTEVRRLRGARSESPATASRLLCA